MFLPLNVRLFFRLFKFSYMFVWLMKCFFFFLCVVGLRNIFFPLSLSRSLARYEKYKQQGWESMFHLGHKYSCSQLCILCMSEAVARDSFQLEGVGRKLTAFSPTPWPFARSFGYIRFGTFRCVGYVLCHAVKLCVGRLYCTTLSTHSLCCVLAEYAPFQNVYHVDKCNIPFPNSDFCSLTIELFKHYNRREWRDLQF